MIKMSTFAVRSVLLAGLGSTVLALCIASAGEPQAVAKDQITYLKESLTEGIGTADAKLIGMCLDAFKASGQEKADLLRTIEDAYYEAAVTRFGGGFGMGGGVSREAMDAWMLAARTRVGDASSGERLQSWSLDPSFETMDETKLTDPKAGPMGPNQWALQARIRRRAEALPALAFVNPVEAEKAAIATLQKDLPALYRLKTLGGMASFYSNPLASGAAKALLACNATKGWATLLTLLHDEAADYSSRVALWNAVTTLSKEADKRAEMLTEFNRLAAEWIRISYNDPNGGQLNGLASTLLQLKQQGVLTDVQSVVASLEKMSASVPEGHRRMISHYIKMLDSQGKPAAGPMNPPQGDPNKNTRPVEIF